MFKLNSYVVYKKDVCIIIDTKKINNIEYYTLKSVNDPSLIINVPTTSSLQKVMTKKEAKLLLQRIKDIPLLDNINNKDIENTYKKLILSGNKEDLVKIIKTTYLRNSKRIKNKKKKSDRDEKYYNQAEKYLYTELSVVLNMTYKEVKDLFNKVIHE
ncbi:MAG: hypothetical protein IKP79_00020 [Bacilli bacterium]|nr:hypothetical protein [Bacilli bacterium]